MKIALRIAFLLFVVVPVAAWFIVKPVRVIAPAAFGMQCANNSVCVETPEKLPEATTLYREALSFVHNHVGPMNGQPLVVFCSTQTCADQFGLGARSAVTVGTMGTVIGPKAWHVHYVRHELIHHLQGQQFGVLRRVFMPPWLIEGMAYSLSEDTRATLAEPWQEYRDQFNKWLASVGRENLWSAASSL
ncbi:hypothetical protein CLU88_2084 [Acidovorax sp. 56]|uniref:hypothetical protein n=1 Tax=Acidovorax sp. 56 TaxID=2035205 RepID=UPI000C1668F9|nr:hypothetical protein [Acidovorax sp. 56]PIF27197.1 hypothetical protein CLU88_2084 [Acidovorax sp. 56]